MVGIILNRKNIREYDQIISFISEQGEKKEVMARGVKKQTSKNSPFLEPSSLLEIETADGKEIEYLIRVAPISLFKNIRKNIFKLFPTGYVLRITDELISVGEKDVSVFELLKSWLCFVDEVENFGDALVDSYLIKLASLLGFRPVLEKCVLGEEDLKNSTGFFSLSLGGMLCPACYNVNSLKNGIIFSLSPHEREYFFRLLNSDWSEISQLNFDKKVSDIIFQFIKYHTEKISGQWINFKNKTALVGAEKNSFDVN